MKRLMLVWLTFVCTVVATRAAIPAAEQLLPADTLVVVTVPDWNKATSYVADSPQGRLWADPAMKLFRESFTTRFSEDVLGPLEKELEIKLAEYKNLIQGQLTFALTQNGWDGKSDHKFGWLLLLDAKDKREQLKTQLADLKKKWVDAGKPVKTEKIRDVEFMTVIMDETALNRAIGKAFPKSTIDDPGDGPGSKTGGETKPAKYEISFGQIESLLIVGNTLKDIEKVLARQAGAAVPALADQGAFEANRGAVLRNALAVAWVSFRPIYEVLLRQYVEAAKPARRESAMAPRMDKILEASGLAGLKAVAFKVTGGADGTFAEAFLSVPEASRQGLIKAFTLEAKEASPPPFIPADAVKFGRVRLNGQSAWATLENLLTSISPEIAGVLQLGFATVGKDKDPNFDLKKNLIGSLGDDFITFEKKPRSSPAGDVNSPSSIRLIGSPNTEKLVQALKAATSLLPLAAVDSAVNEREFLGRKIYSVPLPDGPSTEAGKSSKRSFNFAASAGYVALSTDPDLIEDYLRSAEGMGKGLRETAGLGEAAQKVGGMNNGYFGFANQVEAMRLSFKNLKSDSTALDKILAANPVSAQTDAAEAKRLKGWFDFSLLPAFDKVSKHFHFLVYSFSATSEGMSWKMFAPNPPPVGQ